MSIKKAKVTVSIPEPEGEITTKSIEVEYDSKIEQKINIVLDYTPAGVDNGPVMRPKRPRR